MTFNQIINRLKILAQAHKQIRKYQFGSPTEFLNEKTAKYPAFLMQDLPGNIDAIGKTVTYGFRIMLLDRVNVGGDTKINEQDVQSDMHNIAMDIIAQIDYSGYTDWKIAAQTPTQFILDTENDRLAGVVIDISVLTPYIKNVCAVPANSYSFPLNDNVMAPVYDMVYTTNGTENITLTIDALKGKKILMLIRETFALYEVTNFDANQSTQFKWEYSSNPFVDITLGTSVNPDGGERFLILYRNFV